MKITWRDRDRDFLQTLEGGETTFASLSHALRENRVDFFKAIPGFEHVVDNYTQDIDCDEVYPNIYIGDAATAKNKQYLQKIGITHVLNAAEGNRFGHVNTNQYYYRDTAIEYLGIPASDLPTVDISKYFNDAANFIDNALKRNGKVFVHCVMGVSRSATCVIAFLMIKRNMLCADAIRLIRKSRSIHPNDGFLRQLAALDNQLRRHRL
ncbi:dual specificity protein phosphatase 3 isoform X2 [Microplitis mediator]|uniref:dual specificity protein phosphatase 3 isoform X2 n=1 Tax=Microplitis mediator TaxID=375433 RepID=UPI002554D8EC|nr:dual specificity protein phosphatase 3 isoform X2 [Microplitis mediator]